MIENLEITPNHNNGGICAEFNIDTKKYYADLAFTLDHGNECMIFAFKEDGNINWMDLYAKTGIAVTEDNLRKCIDEFSKQIV